MKLQARARANGCERRLELHASARVLHVRLHIAVLTLCNASGDAIAKFGGGGHHDMPRVRLALPQVRRRRVRVATVDAALEGLLFAADARQEAHKLLKPPVCAGFEGALDDERHTDQAELLIEPFRREL